MKPIAVDWDGTLVDHPPNIPIEEVFTYGPQEMAPKVLNYLVKQGLEFYVLTSRPRSEHRRIRKWLRDNGFPKMKVTNVKTESRLYIDDRGYRFTDWLDIGKLLQ
jgi:hydroxymethylpyrimidine pyrophosphatase-like HAD family hydrolase